MPAAEPAPADFLALALLLLALLVVDVDPAPPVVALLPDLLADGVGRLVPSGDADALAAAMAAVLNAPREAARMGAAGRARAVSTYSWAAVARATADVYTEVIAAHPRPSAPGALPEQKEQQR